MKDRRVTIRIRNADLEFIQENIPDEFENLSDFIRTRALESIKDGEGEVTDTTVLNEIVDTAVEKIMEELYQIKTSVNSIHSTMAAQSTLDGTKMQKILIQQLVDLWLKDPKLGQLHSYDELVQYVKYDYLKDYSRAAIQELIDRKLLTVTRQEKLKWNL